MATEDYRVASYQNSNLNCTTCSLRKLSLLADLSVEDLSILNKNKYEVTYKAGETICKKGMKSLGLVCLNKGKVKVINHGVNGIEHIVSLQKEVDFLGFRDLMADSIYLNSTIALEDVAVCVIEKNDIFKVVASNSQLAFKLIKHLSNELIAQENRTINLTQKHFHARLADALLMINDICGVDDKNGTLALKLKRADMAALANMTASNTTRALSYFSKIGIIETNGRLIKIINLKALKEVSQLGA